MLLMPQCTKRTITIPEQKPAPMLTKEILNKEIAIEFLNKNYPEYNTDSIAWQYAYIREFDDGSSLLKVVWNENEGGNFFTDILLWTNNDTIQGVLFEVIPDTAYIAEKKIWLGEGYNTRYYVYDNDFIGWMVIRDLKTHKFIEGRVYEDGRIVGYIYPKEQSLSFSIRAEAEFYKITQLDNITIHSPYPKKTSAGGGGRSDGFSFPGGSFGGGGGEMGGGSGHGRFQNAKLQEDYSAGGGGQNGMNGKYSNKENENPQKQYQPTPAESMKALAKNPSFQKMMIDLTTKLKAEVEYGYTYRQKGGEYETKLFEGIPGAEVPMSFPKNNPIDGWVHTHYEVNGMNATGYIFSMHDIWLMADLYTRDGMADPNTFSIGVISPQNTYMLKIENMTLFKSFAEKYTIEDNLIDKIDEKKYYFGSPDQDKYETNVLRFLRDFETGMILYKTKTDQPNQQFNRWQKPTLSTDGSTVTNQDF